MTKPIIFLAYANDQQNKANYLRGLSQEQRGIRLALQGIEKAGLIEIVERVNVALSDIIDVFTDSRYQNRIAIFHYAGHADSYVLMLENAAGTGNELANIAGFSSFLGRQAGLELVFLNACSTQEQANLLLNKGVKNVIATSSKIKDTVATQFSTRFYKGIGNHQVITQSYQDARDEALTLSGENNFRKVYWDGLPDVELPQAMPWDIYPPQGSLWAIERPVAPPPPPAQKVGPFSHLLCNRVEQNDEFKLSYSQAIVQPVRKPQIFLIRGLKEDRHDSLITRFSWESIGKRVFVRPNEIKNWPIKGAINDLKQLLKLRIVETFETLNWQGKTAANISAMDVITNPFFSTQKNVILQHNIPGEEWNQSTIELLNWYIGEFWNVEQKDSYLPNFTIFINVLYSPDQLKSSFLSGFFSKKYFKKDIQAELQKLADAYTTHCRLLSELVPITKDNVETWVVDTHLADVSDFLNISSAIFSSSSLMLPMAHVEIQLKKAIDGYIARNSGIV